MVWSRSVHPVPPYLLFQMKFPEASNLAAATSFPVPAPALAMMMSPLVNSSNHNPMSPMPVICRLQMRLPTLSVRMRYKTPVFLPIEMMSPFAASAAYIIHSKLYRLIHNRLPVKSIFMLNALAPEPEYNPETK